MQVRLSLRVASHTVSIFAGDSALNIVRRREPETRLVMLERQADTVDYLFAEHSRAWALAFGSRPCEVARLRESAARARFYAAVEDCSLERAWWGGA